MSVGGTSISGTSVGGTTAFTAAVCQMRSGADLSRNVEAMDALVREAAGRGATYIQTPEMTGLVQAARRDFFAQVRDERDDPAVRRAEALARELGIHLHIGSTPIRVEEARAANRAFLFGPRGRVATYDKIHMFDVDLDGGESWRESAVYRPGTRAVVADMDEARLGLGICYDVRFPALFRAQAEAGATVLTAPSCFTRQTGRAHWHVLQRARAIECGAFVVSAAQGGRHEDGRETYGHSLIVSPWGEVLAEVEGDEPGIAVADIDVSAAHAARAKVPNLVNVRAFDPPTALLEAAE